MFLNQPSGQQDNTAVGVASVGAGSIYCNEKRDSNSSWGGGNNQQPPDLDEIFKKLGGALSRVFGGSGNPQGDGEGGGGRRGSYGKFGSIGIGFFALAVLVVWGLSGIYIVSEGSRGVVLRFGAYQYTTSPGPHWHIPYPVEVVEKVDVDRIRSAQNKTHMLTEDENIVEVELATQYRVKDAPDYLFNVRLPDAFDISINQAEGTLFQVMESALREVVGKSEMDFILGAGRAEIASRMRSLMQETLDDYRSGIEVVSVNLQQSQPPQAVQDAFADAIKAREDEIRFVNEAEAYANGVIPQARGQAARMVEEATAYREKVTASSKGEADRFLKLYAEYRKAPEVTRERLYLQAIESVLSNSSKVIMDMDGGNSLFYLPIDKIFNGSGRKGGGDGMLPDDIARQRNTGEAMPPPVRERVQSDIERLRKGRN